LKTGRTKTLGITGRPLDVEKEKYTNTEKC
jgi:hypothetical protein